MISTVKWNFNMGLKISKNIYIRECAVSMHIFLCLEEKLMISILVVKLSNLR